MNDQLATLLAPAQKFLSKHHSVLFISFILLLLAIAIYVLYDVTTTATAPINDNSSTISSFDQKTIDKIKNLHDSSDTSEALVFPSPRSNPFSE